MTALSSESVLAELRQLPLLTAAQLARVESAARKHAPGPEKIVQRLLDKGWLTPFQAEVLLSGKGGGLVFGNYVLLSRLGEGGMGAVFKARHIRLGRIDAVKVIRDDKIASKLVAQRFLREIRLTADLNHPHIIKALDAGQVGKQLYLATEYVAGEDLTKTVFREGPFSVADACLVVFQTALALRHIHERGLIHRDMKPSNIMREEKTRAVKLLDLGLSGNLHELPDAGSEAGLLTREGVMLGTPDFMPPEQARNPHGVDIRADLYGLGATFYYLLTARTPYGGSPIEKLTQHASAPPPTLVLPRIPTPPALAAIVTKLMAKRPEDRFQTPQELIDSLLALRPGEPSTAIEPVPVPEWQSQFDLLISRDPSASGSMPIPKEIASASPSRQRIGWIVAVAVAAMIVPLVAYFSTRNRSTGEPNNPGPAQVEEEPVDELKALRKAVLATGENRDQLRSRVLAFRAKNAGAPPAVVASGLLRKLPSPLDRLSPEKGSFTETPVVRLGSPGEPVAWMSFSPTDERLTIARVGKPPEEWQLPAMKESSRWRGIRVAEEGVPSGTPDGRTVIAVDARGKLAVWSDGKLKPVDIDAVTMVAVAPNGKSAVVAFANNDERLARINLETGKIANHLDHPSDGVTSLVVSPDGASCLVIGPESMIRVLSLSSGKLVQAFDNPSEAGATPSGQFGPDGQRLYLLGAFRTAGRFAPGSASPDVLFEVGQDRPNPFVPRLSRPGRPTCIAVSADESAVAVGTRAGNLYVYAASTGKSTHEFRFNETIKAIAFSTHGRVLAVALDDGTVLLVPLKG